MPSIVIVPEDGWRVERRERASVDLPLPVRPVMAVVMPPGMVQVMLCSAGSRWGAYFIVTSEKTMSAP